MAFSLSTFNLRCTPSDFSRTPGGTPNFRLGTAALKHFDMTKLMAIIFPAFYLPNIRARSKKIERKFLTNVEENKFALT